jgi:hypothetical protein
MDFWTSLLPLSPSWKAPLTHNIFSILYFNTSISSLVFTVNTHTHFSQTKNVNTSNFFSFTKATPLHRQFLNTPNSQVSCKKQKNLVNHTHTLPKNPNPQTTKITIPLHPHFSYLFSISQSLFSTTFPNLSTQNPNNLPQPVTSTKTVTGCLTILSKNQYNYIFSISIHAQSYSKYHLIFLTPSILPKIPFTLSTTLLKQCLSLLSWFLLSIWLLNSHIVTLTSY